MFGAPYSSSHPVCEIPEMIQASSQTGSTMMNNYKESSIYVVPSVAGLQYGATSLQDLDSTARNNNLQLSTGGHGLLGEVVTTSMPRQLHHASPLATPGSRTNLNLDVIDNLLTFSDGVAQYGSIFQVDNNIPRTAAAAHGPSGHISDGTTSNSDGLSHSVELPRSPVTACTSLLSTLALQSGTTGGSEQPLSTSSVSMEAWNAPTAFSCPSTATPPMIPVFHGPSVGGLGKTSTNDLSVVGLNMPVGSLQAFPDLQQADYKLASRQFLSLPALPSVNNIQAISEQLATVPTPPQLEQPWVEVCGIRTPYRVDTDFVSMLNSQLDQATEGTFAQPEGCCATQVPIGTSQFCTTLAELRQDMYTTGMGACPQPFGSFHPGHSLSSGLSGESRTSSKGQNVGNSHRHTSKPSRLRSSRLQMEHATGTNDAGPSARVDCRLQPRGVGVFSSGFSAMTIDSPLILPPWGKNQDSMLQTGPERPSKATGDNIFRTAPLPMDLACPAEGASIACPTDGTETMVYQDGTFSHAPGNTPNGQRRLRKVVPLVRSAVDHPDVMQAFPSASGSGNFTSALNVPNISKLPAQSSSKDMLKAEDHVARERRRRDIMNTRFQVLESLLPKPICRHDRYGIVEDTVLYVKEMEQLVANLNVKAASLKERLEQQEALRQQLQLVQRQPVPALELCTTVASDCLPIELVHLDGFPRARWCGNIAQDPDRMPPDSKVEVIATLNQPHIAIAIECRLEFGGRLFGGVLRSIERLDLDVRQCSITNCSNLYLCNASCKPWHGQLQLSYEQILQQLVTYLRSYLKRI